MADRFDELMKGIAEEANQSVDYEAMKKAILSANAKQKKERFLLYRKLTMAAAFVVLVGGGVLAARSLGVAMKAAAPEEAAYSMESAAAYDSAVAAGALEEPAAEAPVAEEPAAAQPAPAALEAPAEAEPAVTTQDEEAPKVPSTDGGNTSAASGSAEPRMETKAYSQEELQGRINAIMEAQAAQSEPGQRAITAEELSQLLPGASVYEAEVPEGLGLEAGEAMALDGAQAEACWRCEKDRCLYIVLPGASAQTLLQALSQAVSG